MRRLATQWITVLALCVTVGLHWAALQTVAWTTMFLGYVQSESVVSAFQKTFDGEHPCQLCLAVKTGRAAQKSQEATAPTPKLDWFLELRPVSLPTVPPLDRPEAGGNRPWHVRMDTPPLPPPRIA